MTRLQHALQERAALGLRAQHAPAPLLSIEARAAQLVEAWLRGYMERKPVPPPMPLEDLAELAFVAREWAERERTQSLTA